MQLALLSRDLQLEVEGKLKLPRAIVWLNRFLGFFLVSFWTKVTVRDWLWMMFVWSTLVLLFKFKTSRWFFDGLISLNLSVIAEQKRFLETKNLVESSIKSLDKSGNSRHYPNFSIPHWTSFQCILHLLNGFRRVFPDFWPNITKLLTYIAVSLSFFFSVNLPSSQWSALVNEDAQSLVEVLINISREIIRLFFHSHLLCFYRIQLEKSFVNS